MTRFFADDRSATVPGWVVDHDSFRRWLADDDFPERGRVSFLRGEVWIDLSQEHLHSHNAVKEELARSLNAVAKAGRLGKWFGGEAFVSSREAGFSAAPDGLFITAETERKGAAEIAELGEGRVEVVGCPDLVAEVVGAGSVERDTEVLREAYAAAGIAEFWLIDAREASPRLDVHRLQRGRYVAVRKRAGWTRSDVLGRSFRLLHTKGDEPAFTLEARVDK